MGGSAEDRQDGKQGRLGAKQGTLRKGKMAQSLVGCNIQMVKEPAETSCVGMIGGLYSFVAIH